MNDILVMVSDFFANLESREKRALKIGALVLAVLITVMLVFPKLETYSQVKSQRDALKADVVWLQEKRDLVAGLVNNCPSVRQQKDDFKADLTHLVSRNQLKVVSTKQKENSISMVVSGSKSNQLLKFMHQIACRGYILGELKLVTEEDDLSKITATLEVERVN
ncbi:MAG: type II secretion system protein GspM [Porticoccaceae bacterium]